LRRVVATGIGTRISRGPAKQDSLQNSIKPDAF
jgi:hypothetical protein